MMVATPIACRVLPDLSIARLAAKEADILHADISTGLRSVIILVEMFPGRWAHASISYEQLVSAVHQQSISHQLSAVSTSSLYAVT